MTKNRNMRYHFLKISWFENFRNYDEKIYMGIACCAMHGML